MLTQNRPISRSIAVGIALAFNMAFTSNPAQAQSNDPPLPSSKDSLMPAQLSEMLKASCQAFAKMSLEKYQFTEFRSHVASEAEQAEPRLKKLMEDTKALTRARRKELEKSIELYQRAKVDYVILTAPERARDKVKVDRALRSMKTHYLKVNGILREIQSEARKKNGIPDSPFKFDHQWESTPEKNFSWHLATSTGDDVDDPEFSMDRPKFTACYSVANKRPIFGGTVHFCKELDALADLELTALPGTTIDSEVIKKSAAKKPIGLAHLSTSQLALAFYNHKMENDPNQRACKEILSSADFEISSNRVLQTDRKAKDEGDPSPLVPDAVKFPELGPSQKDALSKE